MLGGVFNRLPTSGYYSLEKCEDDAVFRQAAAFAVESWPSQGGGGGWGGSTVFPMAALHACPAAVARVALPKLVHWPHRNEIGLLKKIGAPAIPALVARHPKARGKVPGMIVKALRELGPEGDKAAGQLEKD